MGSMTMLAQEAGYWLAGILTLIAAVVVAAVILISSRNDRDEIR